MVVAGAPAEFHGSTGAVMWSGSQHIGSGVAVALKFSWTGDVAMDSMETDAELAVEMTRPTSFLVASDPNQYVRELLALARQLIGQGKPSHALHAVVMATRYHGGESAVYQILNRAQELYKNKLRENVSADGLASLFAECVIAEAEPSQATQVSTDSMNVDQFHANTFQSMEGVSATSVPVAHDTSILAESGRKQIVLDAFADGNNFICLQCGGLVSLSRKEEHLAIWCHNI